MATNEGQATMIATTEMEEGLCRLAAQLYFVCGSEDSRIKFELPYQPPNKREMWVFCVFFVWQYEFLLYHT